LLDKKKISPEEINQLPLRSYQGPVHVIKNQVDEKRAIEVLMKEEILGFDTETRPAYKKGEYYPVSIIQFAGAKAVYIFLLKPLGGITGLMNILSSTRIKKVGVGLLADVRKLKEIKDFKDAGFLEITTITQALDIKNRGLRGLLGLLLGFRISKSAQTSNWANLPLTKQQISYAATDAWAGRELYLKAIQLCYES